MDPQLAWLKSSYSSPGGPGGVPSPSPSTTAGNAYVGRGIG